MCTALRVMKANGMHYISDLFDKVLYMFQTCQLSIIRSISTMYIRNRYLSCYFCWRLLAWSVWNVKKVASSKRTTLGTGSDVTRKQT